MQTCKWSGKEEHDLLRERNRVTESGCFYTKPNPLTMSLAEIKPLRCKSPTARFNCIRVDRHGQIGLDFRKWKKTILRDTTVCIHPFNDDDSTESQALQGK